MDRIAGVVWNSGQKLITRKEWFGERRRRCAQSLKVGKFDCDWILEHYHLVEGIPFMQSAMLHCIQN